MKTALWGVLGFCAWAGVGAAAARAQDTAYEIYQDALAKGAIQRLGLRLEGQPEGKRIEKILVAGHDVLTDGDPWPAFLTAFHAQTREEVVRRELLFGEGESWRGVLVSESERNLRQNILLGMAEIYAVRGTAPDSVIALVVTKDLWSLRLNWDFSFADSKLETLNLELAEFNLNGMNRKAGVIYNQDLVTGVPGVEYADPRLGGSRVALSETATVIFNRATQAREGESENLSIGQPLFSLGTEWAWNVGFSYQKSIYRLFSGGQLAQVLDPATNQALPYSYGSSQSQLLASVTRSFGAELKQDLAWGYRGFVNAYADPSLAQAVSAQTLSDFRSSVEPYSESAGMVFVSYHRYEASYLKLQDIASFALTEDYKLGLDFTLEARLANPALGFSSSFFQLLTQTSYTAYRGDDLFISSLALSARYQTGIIESNFTDESLQLSLTNHSPRFGWFRFASNASLIRRQNDLNRTVSTLGEDTLLRGYPSAYLVAPNLWTTNLELRTLPLEYRTVYSGLVAFLDMGDAFANPASLDVFASVGVGARFVFPQFNRAALRIDAGVPLKLEPGISPVSIVAQFGQAF